MPPKRRIQPPMNYEQVGRGRDAVPRAFSLMKPIKQMDRIAVAWATGLFEGEGGVSADRSGRETRLHVSQSGEADAVPLVLQRYRDAVGGIGAIYGPQLRPPRRPKWQY